MRVDRNQWTACSPNWSSTKKELARGYPAGCSVVHPDADDSGCVSSPQDPSHVWICSNPRPQPDTVPILEIGAKTLEAIELYHRVVVLSRKGSQTVGGTILVPYQEPRGFGGWLPTHAQPAMYRIIGIWDHDSSFVHPRGSNVFPFGQRQIERRDEGSRDNGRPWANSCRR